MDKSEVERRKSIMIKMYGGLHPMSTPFYDISILYSAERAMAAYDKFLSSHITRQNSAATFADLQDALSHAGGVSRFFFPLESRGNRLADVRRAALRKRFVVEDDSPLAQRGFRNALEHFDERLDEFIIQDIAGFIIPGPIVGDIDLSEGEPGHLFKFLNPSKGLAIILGEEFSYENIFSEVERIRAVANALN